MDTTRIFSWNEHPPNAAGQYVLYWMQINRRLHYNFALQYAVEKANELGKPLLIYEGLKCNYPWASDRIHSFVIDGMREHATELQTNYYAFVETNAEEGKGLVRSLIANASLVVTDHYPAFVIRDHNERLGPTISVPYVSVDSNGILPLRATMKAPYMAFHFRSVVQKTFVTRMKDLPEKNPLEKVKNRKPIDVPRLPFPASLDSLPIDHAVKPVSLQGTRAAALKTLRTFVKNNLALYEKHRNDPDSHATSGLSPYLHFGKISSHEIIQAILPHRSRKEFLDQLVTWREIGFHFCHHVRNFDQFDSLPDWAKQTLRKHASDERPYLYSLEQLENAQTHDDLWNAAQMQLLQEGIIHNYLRMLWGKKILEWTPDPETALQYMIHLNNKYAIDGRDPNSYSGIFWVLGRFDRPWPERPIYGTVRSMSSTNTARKVRLKEYLNKYKPPRHRDAKNIRN